MSRKYTEEQKARKRETQKLWYSANQDKLRAYNRQWYSANQDKVRASVIKYQNLPGNKEIIAQRKLVRHRTVPFFKMLQDARTRAKKKGIEFALTPAWATARYTGRCELTDIEFVVGQGRLGLFSPSLDRVVPNKGYTPKNSRFVIQSVNSFKSNGSDDTMILVARKLATLPLSTENHNV